jgi:glycosyltransferase involved in cell wall biosynthesis
VSYNLTVARIAWFTPLAPVRSGISSYSAEILPFIRRTHEVDVYDEPAAHGFVPVELTNPYELIVYQMGNASCHDFMWPYMLRHPGLLVLHDAQLHQSRALALLAKRWRPFDYQAEFVYSHPASPIEITNFVINGDCRSVYALWPMLRLAFERSRLVAVHNRWLAHELAPRFPGTRIETIRMGVADFPAGDGPALRRRLGIPPRRPVFACFGRITPEKRLTPLFEALARVACEHDVHLLLVGEVAAYYDAYAELDRVGIRDRTTLTGFVADEDLGTYLDIADVCVCLRWPTSRETSASWLRCLSAGKATIVTDLAHTASIATIEPASWTTRAGSPDDPSASIGPIAIALDLVDEQWALENAMRRLVIDPELRESIGRRARQYCRAAHNLDLMAADYGRILDLTLATEVPTPSDALPHLRVTGWERVVSVLHETGLAVNQLDIPIAPSPVYQSGPPD